MSTERSDSTMEQIARAVETAVDALEGDLVACLQELVRIPTENPPGKHYTECAQAIGTSMRRAGCSVEYLQTPPELLAELAPHGQGLPRVSVLGRLLGPRPRPHLHITGHYDVVPAGEGWSVDPYGGELREGRVYGRGSSDQKSGIAAQIFAVQALRRAGVGLKGSLTLSATPDEETGGFAGMGYLVDRGVIGTDNTDFCIITECLDVDRVCLGHRGTLWLELETQGRQSHGSMPFLGVNALEKMLELLRVIDRDVKPRLVRVSAYPVQPPECRESSLSVTKIDAGTKVNVLPARCVAALDIRLGPEQSLDEARDAIGEVLERFRKEDPRFQGSLRILLAVEPTLVPDDTEVVRAIRQSGRDVLGGELSFSISPGSDDQKFIVQKAGLEQCVVYGPGPLALAHQSDEYQPVADLKAGTRVLALTAARLLGVR